MEKLGVIEKVSELTELFSGMVVVTKPLGRIRICIDLKPPNESVFHPSPKVDATLALLSESKVFSNLDANSSIWKVPLSLESWILTRFITIFTLYCFNWMPFGVYVTHY